jgi:exopolysaccharide production protein ExoQ
MLQKKINILKLFEQIFTVLGLFHLSQAVTPLLISGGASEGDGVDQLAIDFSFNAKLSLLVLFVTCVLLFLRWKKILAIIYKNPFIWLLLLILYLSYFWSLLPDQTLKYAVYATGATLFGLYLGTRYSLKEQMKLLAWTFALMLILSILFAVGLPKYGLMGGVWEGAWRGIFTHKNQFGLFLVVAGVLFFLQALRKDKFSWLFWLLLSACIGTAVLSRSTTTLANLGLMLMLCIIYRVLRWRYEILISALLLGAVAGIVAILFFIGYIESDALFAAFGKDATFSGRTLIWDAVLEAIKLRPWQGYGLAAFWNGIEGPSGIVELSVGAKVAYAHNGFLDICLSIGIVGLSIFLLGFLDTLIKSLALLRNSNEPEGFWPLLFVTYIVLSNLSEGTITTMDNGFWAIYAAIAFSLIIAKENKYNLSE